MVRFADAEEGDGELGVGGDAFQNVAMERFNDA